MTNPNPFAPKHTLNDTYRHQPGTAGTLLGTSAGGTLVEESYTTAATASNIVKRGTSGEITVPATPSASTDAASKGYVDSTVSALLWQAPVAVGGMVNDALNQPAGGETAGQSFVVGSAPAGAWAGFSAGDIVELVGAVWTKIVANSGGYPPAGTRVIVTGYGGGTGAGSFAAKGNQIGVADGAGAWTFSAPSDGWTLSIKGDGGQKENQIYIYDSTAWLDLVIDHNDSTGLQGGTASEYYHLTSAQHTEITTFFGATDITGAEAELLTDGSDVTTKHMHDARYDSRYHHRVTVGGIVNDTLNQPAGGETAGQSFVVGSAPAGAWAGFSAGDIVELDSLAAWNLVLANSGGYVPSGTKIGVTCYGGGTAAGSFAGQAKWTAIADGAGSWSFTSPSDGDMLLVIGENATEENHLFIYDTSAWVNLSVDHNDTQGLQGGTASEYYHLTSAQHALQALQVATITGASDPPTLSEMVAGLGTNEQWCLLETSTNALYFCFRQGATNVGCVKLLNQYSAPEQFLVKMLDHDDYTAGAASESVSLGAFPANVFTTRGWCNLATEFSGGGVVSCVVELGDAGDTDGHMTSTNVFTGAGTGLKVTGGAETGIRFESAYAPELLLTVDGGHTVADLTAGVIHCIVGYLPCPTFTEPP